MAAPRVDKTEVAVLTDDQFKDHLYEVIAKMVRAEVGRMLAKPKAQKIFHRVVEMIFQRVVESGYFRFPGGYGSLKLTKLRENAAPRVMPGGEVVQPRAERYKIRYKDGVAVMEMLGTSPHKYKRKKPRPSAEASDPASV